MRPIDIVHFCKDQDLWPKCNESEIFLRNIKLSMQEIQECQIEESCPNECQ